ncbi:unnamed protein product [Notodromas monacha]|uniref:tRNA (guanine-N(7)-)-methyltransferase n=1 Tax=Notodromas monacha TaxID=399045 RepID=A0A7R9GCM7_9CRUS|nr:unnamed protein product [Notodromas monacha]CAG0916138.1 unnamed protein product [Notodromas monacha]
MAAEVELEKCANETRGEEKEKMDVKETRLPQKRFFRQRAHCNPLSDRPMYHPEKPELMDWSEYYPHFFKPGDAGHSEKRVEILDVGCGYGGLLLELAKIFPEKLALGFEIRTKVSKYVQCKIEALRKQEPGKYQNAACIRTNAMKYMLNFFAKEQLTHMFFLFPDPHFKKKKHKWRIINDRLLHQYAFCMAVGGLVYTLTDVEQLHQWMVKHLRAHPLFEEVPEEELKGDPVHDVIWESSEEGKKVTRNEGSKFLAVFKRIEVPGISAQSLMDSHPPTKRVKIANEESNNGKSETRGMSMNKVFCNEHPDATLIEDYHAGDQICSECGKVVGDRVIDVGTEWRTFGDKQDQDPSRVGAAENPLLGSGDLSTMIGPSNHSASFDEFGAAKYQNKRTMSSSDRTLINSFREIGTMADRINLPRTIVDRANLLFKQVHESRSLKGRSNDAIASACLYIACRQENVPRTFKEICAISKVSKKEIGLPNPVQRAATHIAKKAGELDIVPGRSPISVAAAAIYMASQASEDKKTPKEIGDVAGVADVTIKQAYKLMYPRAAELFPKDFKFFTPVEQLPLQ